MINTKEIRKRMIDADVTYTELAEAIKKQPTTVRQKIFNYRPMFLHEAEAIAKVLKVTDDEFAKVFFDRKSRSVNIKHEN